MVGVHPSQLHKLNVIAKREQQRRLEGSEGVVEQLRAIWDVDDSVAAQDEITNKSREEMGFARAGGAIEVQGPGTVEEKVVRSLIQNRMKRRSTHILEFAYRHGAGNLKAFPGIPSREGKGRMAQL
jgi:hypothetical protein